jgi:hypothetical protein
MKRKGNMATKNDNINDLIFDVAELENFLSTKEGVLNVLEQLRGRVIQRWRFETLKAYIKALVERHGTHQSHSILASNNLTLCRVRGLQNDEKPEFSKELGARDPADTIDYGRCNWPQNPMLYCSLYEDTALTEVDAEIDRRYVVATYRVSGDLVVLPIGELDWFRRTGTTQLGVACLNTSLPYQQASDGIDGDVKVLVDAFFADEFMKSANSNSPAQYRLTSALSNVLYEANWETPIDAIFYPSVAFRAGCNFAIRPQAALTKLTLLEEETKILKVRDAIGYGIFQTETEAVLKSIGANGELVWGAPGNG